MADHWDSGLGNFLYDLTIMCENLEQKGMVPRDLVVGREVGFFLRDNKLIEKMLDVKNFSSGFMKPEINVPGVVWLSTLNFAGYKLDIFIALEKYENENGIRQRYFPAKSAMITFPGCGSMKYAQITQIEHDYQYWSHARTRVPSL